MPEAVDPRQRVVFLGGLGRSGTTLLERLLAEVPGTCPVGELVHLWARGVGDDELCGCSRPFSECPFWSRVGEVAFGGWDRVDLERIAYLRNRVERTRHVPLLASPRMPATFRAELQEYVAAYGRLYAAIGTVSGSSVVVDSSKHASLAYCLRWQTDIDLRVVHMVRDSRAVAYSWTKEVQRPEARDGGNLMTRYSPGRSSLLWDVDNLAFEALGRLGVPVLRVRYEDLTARPADTMERIAGFAGLEMPAEQLGLLREGVSELRPSHTVSGNPMRFRTGRTTIREDVAWHSALADRDRRQVSALTAPLLRHYGYRVGRSAS